MSIEETVREIFAGMSIDEQCEFVRDAAVDSMPLPELVSLIATSLSDMEPQERTERLEGWTPTLLGFLSICNPHKSEQELLECAAFVVESAIATAALADVDPQGNA